VRIVKCEENNEVKWLEYFA